MERLKQKLTVGNILVIVILILGFVSSWGVRDFKIEDHQQKREIHSTYEDNARRFIPRTEFVTYQSDMKEVKADIKTLLQRIPAKD